MSQQTVYRVNALFGLKCRVVGSWLDRSSRHRQYIFPQGWHIFLNLAVKTIVFIHFTSLAVKRVTSSPSHYGDRTLSSTYLTGGTVQCFFPAFIVFLCDIPLCLPIATLTSPHTLCRLHATLKEHLH
jgi:hypothetical protein